MQPQGHVQLLLATLVHGLDPQSALDAPRFCIGGHEDPSAGSMAFEDSWPEHTVRALRDAGHNITAVLSGHARSMFGRGQFIYRSPEGVLCGGSDGRGDGQAVPVLPLHTVQ